MNSEPRKMNSQIAMLQLREMIFSGRLPPGSNHLETELAAELGMSRTPIREAAVMLEAQGLVQLQPRHGIRVRGLSVADMREIYDVLGNLESLAAARAAEAGHPIERLEPLMQSITAMEQALAAGDRLAWARADEVFHTELVTLSDNRHLVDAVARVNDQVRRARNVTLYLREMPESSTEDHRAVANAIAAGDADAARSLHAAHRDTAREMMTRLLEQIGLQQF